jgi:hypothetical protein
MTLAERAEQDAKSEQAQARGGWFKFKEGKNRFRILAEPQVIYEDFKLGICYTDCGFKGSIKYLTYIWDYLDETIKLMKIPFSIFNWIASLELDIDWKFDGFPMPFDITVDAKDAGTKEVKYSPTPSPRREEMPAEVIDDLKRRKPALEIIDGLKKKNEEKHRGDGTWDDLHAEGTEKTGEPSAKKSTLLNDPIKYPEEEINPEDIPF